MSTNHHVHHSGDPEVFTENAVAALQASGRRVTRARRLLLGVLARNHDHLTADEVADLLQDDGIHRVTVYRTLDALTEVGVVTHLQMPGGATAYHLSTDSHLHGHCLECNRVIALPAGAFDEASATLQRSAQFLFDPNRSSLLGVCAACQSGH